MKTVIFLICIFFTVEMALAQTVSFPATSPEFSFNLPSGWQSNIENGMLSAFPGDESLFLMIWEVPDVSSIDAALDALEQLMETMVQVESMEEAEEVSIDKLLFTVINGTGKDITSGDKVELSVALVSPKGKKVFILLFIAGEMTPKNKKDMKDLLTSFK